MLRSIGYRNIVVAEDGLQAWNILKRGNIDLVISDWNMPNMTGIELLHKIRSKYEYENLPFIMVTGEIDEGSVSLAAEIDVDAYLLKPFIPKQLEERMDLVIRNKNNPSYYQRLLTFAREMHRKKNFEDAMGYLDAATGMCPEKALGHCYIGELYEEMEEYDAAGKAYERALSINPKYIKALEGLSRLYERDGEKVKLLGVLNILIGLSPDNVERLMSIGRLALEVGSKDRARTCLLKVARLQPKNEQILFEIGTLFLNAEMFDDAEAIFETLLKKEPKNQAYLVCSGDILRNKGKCDAARSMYLSALRIAESEHIHYKLAQLYIGVASRRLAEHHLESALLINPEFQQATVVLDKLNEIISKIKESKARQ